MKIVKNSSKNEITNRKDFYNLYKKSPIPKDEILSNLGLFINRQTLSRVLFLNDLYQKIISVHGVVMEFGVRWGQNLALFESFRGMYEPFNYNRKIIGFDTFSGFPSLSQKDGKNPILTKNAYSVSKGYYKYLEEILDHHERESPISHIKKYEIVKGNAVVETKKYLKKNPETIISLAYFDFDLYEPTKKVLEIIQPHLTKGSVIGFDELNSHIFPGETIALKEVFGLSKFKIQRSPLNPLTSYIIID